MTLKTSFKGTIAGKQLFVLENGQGQCQLKDLQRYMGKFPTRDMLAFIGTLAAKIDRLGDCARLGHTPVPFHCLPYLALLSIECSNDHRGEPPSDLAFEKAVGMFINLATPIGQDAESHDNEAASKQFLLRMGRQQFEYRGDLRHLLPRTLLIFRDLWPTVPKAAKVVPVEAVKNLTGNDLVQNIVFGILFCGLAESGSFRPYTSPPNGKLLRELFDMGAQGRFLDWISASYAQIRADAKQVILDDTWDAYRFNPLIVHPVVRPDVQPPGNRPIYLAPVGRLVYERATRGLYHDLSKHHDRGSGDNPFRQAFGYVFQEYVGRLLREALGCERVLAEWKYGPARRQKDTPDWVVFDGERAVFVEVKQSGLTLGAKQSGDLQRTREDLRKTLAKADNQLAQFEADARQGARGVERLSCLALFERLIVTWDRIFWCNSLIREEIDAADDKQCQSNHAHVISIEDLEYLLGYCWKGSLFELLQEKRLGPDGQDSMDFHDWMNMHLNRSEAAHANPFLSRMFNQYLKTWGLPPVAVSPRT